MLTYYVVIFLVFIFSLLAQNKNISLEHKGLKSVNTRRLYTYYVYASVIALILIFTSGFRLGVGTDYWSYAAGYAGRAARVWEDIKRFNEPGLGIINKLAGSIYDHYISMFVAAAFITIGLNVKTISKYTEDFTLSIMLYIFIGAWHGSFNGVRQYLAATVLFAGHRLIFEKKFLKYCLVVLLAMSFHATAIIMLPFYFIVNRKINIGTILIILIGATIIRYSYDPLFSLMGLLRGKELGDYEYMQTSVKVFRVLVAFAPLALTLLISKKRRDFPENTFYINLLIVNAALMFSASGSAYLARIGIYTEIYATLAFPMLLKEMRKINADLIKAAILGFYAIFWYVEVSTRISLNNFVWFFER